MFNVMLLVYPLEAGPSGITVWGTGFGYQGKIGMWEAIEEFTLFCPIPSLDPILALRMQITDDVAKRVDRKKLNETLLSGKKFQGRNWNRDMQQWYRNIMKEWL